MKNNHIKTLVLVITILVMMSQAVFAEGTETGTGADAHARRTVLLYMCGSDLETDGAMATHNLKQILNSKYSSDDDVNVVVMTGGAWRWHLDNDKDPDNENSYLVFPEGVDVPDDAVLVPDPADPKSDWIQASSKGSISGVYNQIWEAKGADSPENAGKLVLLDGDGLSGAKGTAVKSDDEHELMSVPDTLKAFINYGVENYPADKYDLILWDHAGGPAGGFAADEHFDRGREYPENVSNQMSFSGIIDALSDNDVTSPENAKAAKKFDFIDFDACLMNSVELNFVLADYALIASSGVSVNSLINNENVDRNAIDYEKVRYAWTEGKEDNEKAATDWNWMVKRFFEMRKDGESAEAKVWLDNLAKQQAQEALSKDNVSAKKVVTREGTGYKVNIKEAKIRSIGSVKREVGVDYLAAEDAVKKAVEAEEITEESADMIRKSFEYSAGAVQGHITDDDIIMETATADEIIRWYNRNESDWDIDTPDNCWYAVKDTKGNLLAAAINDESPDAYYVAAQIMAENDQKIPLFLKFQKGEDEMALTELIFNTTDGGFRPIKLTDLTSTYTVQPMIIVSIKGLWRSPEVALPTSNSTFELNKDSKISFIYTAISDLSGDIGDTDGDGEVYHSSFTVKDVYGNDIDITEIVNGADETLTGIDLARVRHKVYTGEKQTPELVYNGETLKEGEDFTWEFYNEPKTDLIEAGSYRIRFKGIGKFTGYAVRQFSIINEEDAAQTLVEMAEEELAEANKEIAAIVASDDHTKLQEAYARLVDAQNALADAEKILKDTKDLISHDKQKELGGKITELEEQVKDLTGKLTKALTPKKAAIASVKVGKKKMTVKAKTKVAATNGTTYQIRYKVKGTSKWKTVSTEKQKLTIKKLKKGKKYQVQIRSLATVDGNKYYGAWSKTKTTKKIK